MSMGAVRRISLVMIDPGSHARAGWRAPPNGDWSRCCQTYCQTLVQEKTWFARATFRQCEGQVLMADAADDTSRLSPEMKLIREKLFRHIGRPIERKEDARLLTGKGRFSDDFALPGQAYAVLVRSPYAHAEIRSIETKEALASPGVLTVLTGADCAADRLAPIPHSPVPSTKFDMKLTGPNGAKPFISPNYLLPLDRARLVGEGVVL